MKPMKQDEQDAQMLAQSLGVLYYPRQKQTVNKLFTLHKQDEAIVITRSEWRYIHRLGTKFVFHPNMSALRVRQIQRGENDLLVRASGMSRGDHVLDCTLGMGADSIVSAFVVGSEGKVVALESQPVIAKLVQHGLAHYQTDRKILLEAMRRIQVLHADYRSYLAQLDSQSFDYVLFDPMFRKPLLSSKPIQQLKPLANEHPLDKISVVEALRIARKAVLFKERTGSVEFSRLGFPEQISSSHYAWGVLRKVIV